MDEEKYFSHSWALLTRDKGWIKPLLVMTCASLVPIAGALGNFGYGLEWARLTAWGVDAAPKQKNVNVGKCIASGWRGFLVGLGLTVAFSLIGSFLSVLIGFLPEVLSVLVGLLFMVVYFCVSLVFATFLNVAYVRAAIYERAGAGYRLDRIIDMIKRDVRGFLKVTVVYLLCQLVLSVVVFFFGAILVMMFVPAFVAGVYGDESALLGVLAGSMVWAFILVCIGGLVLSFFSNACNLICLTATGLWIRQFDVQRWGRSEDPLPEPRPASERAYNAQASQRNSGAAERQNPRPVGMNSNAGASARENASEEVRENTAVETTADIFTSDYDQLRSVALDDAPEDASTESLLAAINNLTDEEDE